MSPNVGRLASIPELSSAIAINFIDDTMSVSTVAGIFSLGERGPRHRRQQPARADAGRLLPRARPADSNTWAAYWRDGLVYVADFTRGVEILRFSGGARSRTMRAPASRPRRTLRFDPALGGLCPLPSV